MGKGLEISFEVADGITLATLTNQRDYLKEEMRLHLEEGEWLHPEDLANSVKLIAAMDLLIPYFGGKA
jgi:hypothetical protein